MRRPVSRRRKGGIARYAPQAAAALYAMSVMGGLGAAVVADQRATAPAVVAQPTPAIVPPATPPIDPPAQATPAPEPEAPRPRQRTGGIRPITGDVARIVEEEADRVGLDPLFMRIVAAIESSGRCGASTGSYHGLFQISDGEFRRRGGQGSVFGCRENARIAAEKFVEAITNFRFLHGREPDWTETYLTHQQGIAGISEHLKCPSCPAWQSMYRTAEYQRRGAKMARLAIWGNVPADVRAQFGSVDNITSAQFVEVWRRKVEGDGAAAVASATVPVPKPRPAVVPAPKIRAAYVVPCLVLEGPGCSGAPILLPR